MSNLVPANIQVPAHLAGRIGAPSQLASALIGGLSSGSTYPRISIKGSRFRVVEGETETVLESTTIDVVIVGANPRLSKVWYAKPWTPDSEPQAPDCFSLDGISPDPEATDPQNDLCASCPQNAWGSKVTPQGQMVKACADQKRLAVVAADDPSGPVYLLQVTPAALKNLNQYQKELSLRGIPPEIVKTRVSFDTDASFPKLKFAFAGFLDEETQKIVDSLLGSDLVKEITGETARQVPEVPKISALTPAPAAPKPIFKVTAEAKEPAPAPAPATVAAPAQPVTQPRGFGATKPVAAPAQGATQKRGFGAVKPTVASTQTAVPAKADKPAATPAAGAALSLADEIAALIGEVDADDA